MLPSDRLLLVMACIPAKFPVLVNLKLRNVSSTVIYAGIGTIAGCLLGGLGGCVAGAGAGWILTGVWTPANILEDEENAFEQQFTALEGRLNSWARENVGDMTSDIILSENYGDDSYAAETWLHNSLSFFVDPTPPPDSNEWPH